MPGSVITVRRDQAETLLARIYLWEIVKGCVITARHFWRNLIGYMIGRRRTFVVNWPEEKVGYSPAFRGMPVLVQMENGAERCVACGLCEKACPTDCITIFPEEVGDGIQRRPKVFDIAIDRCMFCGLCEEACPEEAIVMSRRVEVASITKEGCLWHKQDLLTPVAELPIRLGHIRNGYDRSPN